jgi:acetylornithine deacetylase/succinyl-diaminopimelate desuccinylase-like protein
MISEIMDDTQVNNTDTLLASFVAIPSVSGNFKVANHILNFVENALAPYDLYLQRFTNGGYPSLVATTQNTKTPKVMLYAHLDVVDAPSQLFKLRLEDGNYLGRGVLDMKAAAVAYLHIIDGLQDVLHSYDIGIMFTTDEEDCGEFGAGMLAKKGYLPEVCIMPDSGFGTHWQVEASAKGCWFARITSIGVSAHGAKPWEGDSASIKLIQALHDIVALFKDGQKPETPTINVSLLQGGKSINQIPAAAMASIDVRYGNLEVFYNLRDEILKICERHNVLLQTVRKWNQPTVHNLGHPLVNSFLRHVALQTGVVPKPFTAYGTSDARFFAEYSVPCVLLSPPGGGAHSDHEWLSKEGYEQFQLILRAYLDEVAKIPAQDTEIIATDALTIPV